MLNSMVECSCDTWHCCCWSILIFDVPSYRCAGCSRKRVHTWSIIAMVTFIVGRLIGASWAWLVDCSDACRRWDWVQRACTIYRYVVLYCCWMDHCIVVATASRAATLKYSGVYHSRSYYYYCQRPRYVSY